MYDCELIVYLVIFILTIVVLFAVSSDKKETALLLSTTILGCILAIMVYKSRDTEAVPVKEKFESLTPIYVPEKPLDKSDDEIMQDILDAVEVDKNAQYRSNTNMMQKAVYNIHPKRDILKDGDERISDITRAQQGRAEENMTISATRTSDTYKKIYRDEFEEFGNNVWYTDDDTIYNSGF